MCNALLGTNLTRKISDTDKNTISFTVLNKIYTMEVKHRH